MPSANRSLDTRLARLERTSRLLAACLGVLLPAMFLAASRPSSPTVLRAERFELIDASGQVQATLEMTETGETGLFIRDDSSRVRLSVAHGPEQTALFIRDRAGDVRLGAAHFSHGGTGVALHGKGMKGAAVMYLKNHIGSVRIFDEQGTVVYRMPGQE